MRRPRTSTLVLGHPVVAVPLFLTDALIGGVATYQSGFTIVTGLALILAAGLTKCSQEAARYRTWRRDYDALDPNYRPPQPIRSTLRFLGALLVAGPVLAGIFWLVLNYGEPNSAAHWIAPLVLASLPALWLLGWVLKRKARRPHRSQDWIVSQALSRPLPAPTAAEAYAWLPDYCRPLFSTPQNPKEQA